MFPDIYLKFYIDSLRHKCRILFFLAKFLAQFISLSYLSFHVEKIQEIIIAMFPQLSLFRHFLRYFSLTALFLEAIFQISGRISEEISNVRPDNCLTWYSTGHLNKYDAGYPISGIQWLYDPVHPYSKYF